MNGMALLRFGFVGTSLYEPMPVLLPTWVNNALAITTGQKRMLEAPDKLIQGSIGITGQVNAVMVDVY